VQRMVEVQHNDYWCYQGNLDTPLGYASSREDFGNWIRALSKATLLVGTRYTYDYDFSRHVFPFTPIELHAGYLLGEERIIVTHSGNYGWQGQNCLVQARHFDRNGLLTERAFRTSIGVEARTQVDLGNGEAVVLERLPVSLDVGAGEAEATQVSYGPDTLTLTLSAPHGATLSIGDGRMRLDRGAQFAVQIGATPSVRTEASKAGLTVRIPPLRTPQAIRVSPAPATGNAPR